MKRILSVSIITSLLLAVISPLAFAGEAPAPVVALQARIGPAWYRGDLHAHTGHSDGSCDSLSGKRVPCPIFLTLRAAKARGLDFLAITDHNSISQYAPEHALQAYFDTLLLIPGREITTFHGHANVFGTTDFIPFRLGTAEMSDAATLARTVHSKGALLSINHPNLPSDERCMGCGWTQPDTDYGQIDAVEVVNGGTLVSLGGQADSPLNGLTFWETRLNAGYHLTGIGGSDNHDPTAPAARQAPVGYPTTVVYAKSLSQADILDGIKSGRVFIDLGTGAGRTLDLTATSGTHTAVMGQTLNVQSSAKIALTVAVKAMDASSVDVIVDGRPFADAIPVAASEFQTYVPLTFSDGAHWARVNVRNKSGQIEMISNPVYFRIGG